MDLYPFQRLASSLRPKKKENGKKIPRNPVTRNHAVPQPAVS